MWILADERPGNTTQSLGLVKTLGWPYKVKSLRFNRLVNINKYLNKYLLGVMATRVGLDKKGSGQLAPPWPDIVIATGWRPANIARWIRKQSRGHTRLVQLARKGGHVADWFDAVITCRYCRLPPHPHRIETVVPLTQISSEQLAQAAARWQHLFDNEPRPRIILLVGGSTVRYRLTPETARRMGEAISAFAEHAGGKVFAVTSRRTGTEATKALACGLGSAHHIHCWKPGQHDNPYLGYLALADVLVVTGESESLLAEAAATSKPVYIYFLPERSPNLGETLKEWAVIQAQMQGSNERGIVRPQGGVAYFCARLIERGTVRPARDLNQLHQDLIRLGYARPFGASFDNTPQQPLYEAYDVACRVRELLGITNP